MWNQLIIYIALASLVRCITFETHTMNTGISFKRESIIKTKTNEWELIIFHDLEALYEQPTVIKNYLNAICNSLANDTCNEIAKQHKTYQQETDTIKRIIKYNEIDSKSTTEKFPYDTKMKNKFEQIKTEIINMNSNKRNRLTFTEARRTLVKSSFSTNNESFERYTNTETQTEPQQTYTKYSHP